MKGIEELAKLFKERDNITKIGTIIGKIVEVNEDNQNVKISILNGTIQKDKFYSAIESYKAEDEGKEVICIMTDNNQELIVIGFCTQIEPKDGD